MENNNQVPNQAPQGTTSSGMSVAALICGILGIVGSFIPIVCYFTFVLAILGIVFGVKGRKTAPANKTGMATAGLVLGIIGTVFGAVGVICAIVAACAVASLPGLPW